jgi:hypothetical protein
MELYYFPSINLTSLFIYTYYVYDLYLAEKREGHLVQLEV